MIKSNLSKPQMLISYIRTGQLEAFVSKGVTSISWCRAVIELLHVRRTVTARRALACHIGLQSHV